MVKASITQESHGSTDVIRLPGMSDLVIVVESAYNEAVALRVHSKVLIQKSAYFRNLLSPGKFAEGTSVAERHEELRRKYDEINDADNSELPAITIECVGYIATNERTFRRLLKTLFLILTDFEIPWSKLSLEDVTNMTVIADGFDGLAILSSSKKVKNVLRGTPWTSKLANRDSEVGVRQQLLMGQYYHHRDAVMLASNWLILKGSACWTNIDQAQGQGPWWHLDESIENELRFRRACVYDAVASLQDYLLVLYTERGYQCKQGLTSSPQCDVFQLGQLAKFLSRTGSLELRCGRATTDVWPNSSATDVEKLLSNLRECPSYQIDPYHGHCGPKKLFKKGLSFIGAQMLAPKIGLCSECYSMDDESVRWSKSQSAAKFDRKPLPGTNALDPFHCSVAIHEYARDFFMSKSKDWDVLLQ